MSELSDIEKDLDSLVRFPSGTWQATIRVSAALKLYPHGREALIRGNGRTIAEAYAEAKTNSLSPHRSRRKLA